MQQGGGWGAGWGQELAGNVEHVGPFLSLVQHVYNFFHEQWDARLFQFMLTHDCGRYPLKDQGNPYCHCWHKDVVRWLRERV